MNENGPVSPLTSEHVEAIFIDCLFKEEEERVTYIPAYGIMIDVGFHPGRIEQYKAEIAAMLDELPDEFKESGGKGTSFVHACMDRHGNQWTEQYLIVEQLCQLGIATGKGAWRGPREMWFTFPGGIPYYVVHTEHKEVKVEKI